MLLVSPRVDAPRMEPHIPLQGPIKRKVDDDNSPSSTTMPEANFPSDSKRLCLDDVTLSMGQGANPAPCTDVQQSPFPTSHNASSMGVSGHGMLLENNHMSGSSIGSPFQVQPNNEVAQKGPLGGSHFDEKGSTMHAVDQELQDLLEELTKMPETSPNDLDLDNILEKDALGGPCHPQPSASSTPKASPQTSQYDSHVPNKEFSPGCNPSNSGSPQMRPSSAGANYLVPAQSKTIASPISSAAPNKSQAQSMHPVSLPGTNWHAQQLKQLAASKQGPTNKPQAASWPAMSSQGLSPPYRQGSSPHHQPFSPQNVMVSGMSSSTVPGSSIQSPQSNLLSSITSNNNAPSGPSPPFGSEKLSSPVLNQQPFSPPNPMMTNISGSSIKSPQNSMVSTNSGPSPPYRPEKLSSPALHQQSFSPQSAMMPSVASTSSSASMQGSLFKPMSTNQAKSMNMMMQQPSSNMQSGLMNESDMSSQDQYSFNNTKPLSHFSSEPPASQKVPLSISSTRPTLLHYLQAPLPPPQPTPPQQAQQVNSSQIAQQQMQPMMSPAPVQQRRVQPSPGPSQPRQEHTSAIVARLQEPLEIPPAVPASALVNGCNIRNHILKQQIIKRQQQQQQQQQQMQLQEKQRQSMMGVASEQRGHFVGQMMNQFPAVSQPMPPECTQSMPTPPPNHRMMPSPQAMLQNTMGSGISPVVPVNQTSGAVVMIPHSPNKQPGMFPPNADFSLSLRQSPNSMGMNSGCQPVHGHPTVRPGMVLASFAPGSLGNHTTTQQHLRQPTMQRIGNVYPTSAQMWTQRMPNQSQMDASMQHFSGNAVFSKQNARPNHTGPSFTQSVAPPNQIAPGVHARQMQKANMGQSSQNLGPMNNQNLRPSLTRVPLQAAMNVMKPMPQAVSTYNQLSAAHSVGPPTYPGQSSASFSRMSTASEMQPQYDFIVQQNDAILPENCSDTDFIDTLMKNSSGGGSDEEWLNNLTMIDDILGQQSSGHV